MPPVAVTFNDPGQFVSGYCWVSPQQFLNDLVPLLSASVSGLGIIISETAPAPVDQDKIWARTVGGYLEGLYRYQGGWFTPNPTPASGAERRIWRDIESSVWSYDGGDGADPGTTPPTITTGAMWQVDHTMDFLIPIGAGTSPSTYDGQLATVIAQGGTAGAEKVAIVSKEMPSHSHAVPLYAGDAVNHADRINTTDELTVQDLNYQSGLTGGDVGDQHTWSHQNLPPVVGVFFIKRTSRMYKQAT